MLLGASSGSSRSTTVLLYNKGDAVDICNWRPAALANTLYKLYTSMLTSICSAFAEAYGFLSTARMESDHRGVRRDSCKCIVAELEEPVVLVYTVSLDFSSAFSMVEHDKLLRIMLDLGFLPTRSG